MRAAWASYYAGCIRSEERVSINRLMMDGRIPKEKQPQFTGVIDFKLFRFSATNCDPKTASRMSAPPITANNPGLSANNTHAQMIARGVSRELISAASPGAKRRAPSDNAPKQRQRSVRKPP
jgi:hypothetical protein